MWEVTLYIFFGFVLFLWFWKGNWSHKEIDIFDYPVLFPEDTIKLIRENKLIREKTKRENTAGTRKINESAEN